MEEETQLHVLLGVANLLAKHRGQQHEVVVVNPDHVVILHIFRDGLCEQAIGFSVCVPSRLVEGNLSGVVVEQGPQDRVC